MKGAVRRGTEGLDAMVGGGENKERGRRWVQKEELKGREERKMKGKERGRDLYVRAMEEEVTRRCIGAL